MLGAMDLGRHAGNPADGEWYDSLTGSPCIPLLTKILLETAKVRKAMEAMLLKAAMKIVTTVNREKDHIPPITTSESNPFPYQIVINPRGDGWGTRMGLF